jgi:sigma-B regulation protein RsbU (phosphoserine phosphatase)
VYENTSLDLAKDDRLILYTDGIIETRSRTGEFFGDDRLQAFIKGHSSDSAGCIADKFIEHLSRWSGRSQERALDDDLTLIVIDVVDEADAPEPGTTINNCVPPSK